MTRHLATHGALRVTSRVKRGSSSPIVVETAAGTFLTKLRGSAQGVAALVAEVIVAELATLLELPVPERVIVTLDDATPSDDRNDELADLLTRSHGENLGFRFLPGATDLRTDQVKLVDPDVASRIVWLDGLVMNPDRTSGNPNIMLWHREPWLIDHGAALPFHHDWSGVTEQSPSEVGVDIRSHLLSSRAENMAAADEVGMRFVTREALRSAVGVVPESFLTTTVVGRTPSRVREAYVAFLWKRLRAPRPFLPSS
jgi:hypothetical protein